MRFVTAPPPLIKQNPTFYKPLFRLFETLLSITQKSLKKTDQIQGYNWSKFDNGCFSTVVWGKFSLIFLILLFRILEKALNTL